MIFNRYLNNAIIILLTL